MKYLSKKTATLIITLLLISFLTFLAFSVIPGDAAAASLGMDATEEEVEALREALGLNRPLPVRYGSWLLGVIKGDFGVSSKYQLPVSELIAARLPVTIWLAVLSMVIAIVVAIPLGILCARKENSVIDNAITALSHIGMAVPSFFMGILLTYFFGIVLKIFTPGGYVSYSEDFMGFLGYLVLPATAVAIPKTAMIIHFLKNSILGQKRLDYVRTAKGKGNSERRILFKHVLRNAIIPVVTLIAMMIADILAGSIVVEQVFSLPGLGRLLIVSISNRDNQVVQAVILYIATVVIVANAAADLIYRVIDPRIQE